jgi:membrane protease YdiL (CAAX protease family)
VRSSRANRKGGITVVRSLAARQSLVFTALVYAMTISVALALPHAALTPLLSGFTPVLGVILISCSASSTERKAIWRTVGLRRAGQGSWPAAVALPLVFLLVAYGAALLIGVADLRPFSAAGLARSVPDLLLVLALGPILVLGEEIGWRGFLLPRLQAFTSRPRAALATGFLHAVFHLPAILFTTTYDSSGSRLVVAPTVVTTITFAGVFYGWLRDRSASNWPVAIAHNTANAAFGFGAAAVVTHTPAALAYTAGESGIATMLAVVAVGTILLNKAAVWRTTPLRTPAPPLHTGRT